MQAVFVAALIAFAAPPPLRGVSRCAVCCAAPQDGPPTPYAADVPYREGEYDPAAADAFFRQRPMAVLRRVVQLTRLSGGFVFAVILDKVLKREEQMTEQRSQALLELVTKLGPAFIKLGQALSIRTDLVPAAYVAGLTKLQDSVRPFEPALGRAVIERELGIRLSDVFSELSPEPVASASIGQVYKGTLRSTGESVAVKVQRPGVLFDVARDLYMLRTLAPAYQRANQINTDLIGLIDAWGKGFVNELDYRQEAAATSAFSAAMAQRGLGSVFAPEVLPDLSSTHVLTTKWVDGGRLSASNAQDVPRLCAVALNAYLTMLLDTGCLHCDPHPGNLLRTPDGRLCILDWGMVQQVPPDLQLSLLEFIANLSAENYERVPDDLVNLGFVPRSKLEELRASGLTYTISRTLRLAAQGGGPSGTMKRLVAENKEKYGPELLAKYGTLDSPEAVKERQRRFREDWQAEMARDALARSGGGRGAPGAGGAVPSTSTTAGAGGAVPSTSTTAGAGGAVPSTSTTADLTSKIEELQQQNADVFAIPDYFVYMSRAFATLEGIGLSADPDYAILQQCFPYLATRLLSDDSPRARGALRTLLYGTGEELNLSQFTKVTEGLQSYSTSTASVASSQGLSAEGRNAAASQLLGVLLAAEPNFVQSVLLREAALALDTAARSSFGAAATAPMRRSPDSGSALPRPLEAISPLLAPLMWPWELARASTELLQIDARDAQRLDNLNVLGQAIRGALSGAISPSTTATAPSGNGAVAGTSALGTAFGEPAGERSGQRSVPQQIEQLRELLQAAVERRSALTRIGVRFGGAVASAQAERLRRRREEVELSALARRLAASGALGLEGLASAIASLDQGLAAGEQARLALERAERWQQGGGGAAPAAGGTVLVGDKKPSAGLPNYPD